jgi:ankyrin repeat protein
VETSYSRTALHIAAQNGNYQAVEYLIQGGANIIAGTEEGDTALHLCVRSALRKFGRIDAYTRLIGCILLGYTDVSMSEVYGGEIARCPRDSGYMPTLRLLRKFGDPACTNRRGLTALDLLAAETPSLNWPLLEATFKEAGKVAFPEEDDYTFEAFDAGALWGTVT